MLSRLASLHRGIIRALHVIVRSMSDADVCPGVLVGCRDLVTVIQHLIVCSSQLTATASTSSQSDDILSLLDNIQVQYKCCF